MNHIKTIKYKDFSWHSIDKPGKKQTLWLEKNFDFEDEDLIESLPIPQRPKLVDRDNYLFMVLQFPYYNKETQRIEASEIDFFIKKDTLITIHNNHLEPLKETQKRIEKDEKLKAKYLSDGSHLLYEVLNALLHYCFPMLNHINQDIDNIEDDIFDIYEKKMMIIGEILRIKRNIVNFRKIMQAHKSVIRKLVEHSEKFYSPRYLHNYFNNLVNHTKDIWDFLENYKETINALHETHESLLSNRLNEIIKTLTIFSVIVFPLTLMAAIFGMNTMNSMPFVNSAVDFWWVIGIMVVGTAGMLILFKTKKWL